MVKIKQTEKSQIKKYKKSLSQKCMDALNKKIAFCIKTNRGIARAMWQMSCKKKNRYKNWKKKQPLGINIIAAVSHNGVVLEKNTYYPLRRQFIYSFHYLLIFIKNKSVVSGKQCFISYIKAWQNDIEIVDFWSEHFIKIV